MYIYIYISHRSTKHTLSSILGVDKQKRTLWTGPKVSDCVEAHDLENLVGFIIQDEVKYICVYVCVCVCRCVWVRERERERNQELENEPPRRIKGKRSRLSCSCEWRILCRFLVDRAPDSIADRLLGTWVN